MWNKEKAIAYLNSHARLHSIGQCARYTRQAIEAGGLVLPRHESARDYGKSLRLVGFSPYFSHNHKVYQPGDVVIINGFHGHPHGHMAMFNGHCWVSDFKQHDLYPGHLYRTHRPHYTVYRYNYKP